MHADFLHLSIAPTPEASSDGHRRISAWMERAGLDPALRGDAEIVLGEALNNIVEHAFATGATPGGKGNAIRVTLRHDQGTLTISIRDRGDAMPGLAPPAGVLPPEGDCTEDLPEGGFGWFLIRQLTHDLRYHRHEGWNRLDLVITHDPAASPALTALP